MGARMHRMGDQGFGMGDGMGSVFVPVSRGPGDDFGSGVLDVDDLGRKVAFEDEGVPMDVSRKDSEDGNVLA